MQFPGAGRLGFRVILLHGSNRLPVILGQLDALFLRRLLGNGGAPARGGVGKICIDAIATAAMKDIVSGFRHVCVPPEEIL